MNHLLRRFRRDITGLIWLSIGIFLSLSLSSYSPTDPSLNTIGGDLSVQNYCGYFGSFLADILFQLMGVTAWVLVVAALRMSVLGFNGRDLSAKNLRWLWAGLLIINVTCLGSLYFPELKFYGDQVAIGGLLGRVLASTLVSVFNFMGVAVILWTLSAVLLVFYTERTLKDLFYWPVDFGRAIYHFIVDILEPKISWIFAIVFESLMQQIQNLKSRPFEQQNFLAVQSQHNDDLPKKIRMPIAETSQELNAPAKNSEKFALRIHNNNPAEKLGQKLNLFKGKETTAKRKVFLKRKVQRRIENWELPKISLIDDPPESRNRVDDKEIRRKADLLVNKLQQFNVRGKVVGVSPGPAVTMFEFKPDIEVKLSNITKLADDLSLALSSESVRIIAPIPGRDVVGIETSNATRETVYLKDILAENEFWDEEIKLPLTLGRQADGTPRVVDLRKMPHLLVAGSTGSGKSVFTVSAITSLLFRHSPKTLRLILVDPKQVDLAAFSEIPHLLIPPVRESKKAIGALKWAIREMEKRYSSMSKFGARGLEDFNVKVGELSKSQVEEHAQINEQLEGAAKLDSYYFTPQPYICIVVEEFGDLMAVDKNNVEQAVVRLAQMARASGIHLFLAMQSPRKDVVTGLIKTNIPGRISFKVASKTDSRIILDESGAERLLTRGDMLFLAPGEAKPGRHHGPWLSDEDINKVNSFWRDQAPPDYDALAMRAIEGAGGGFELPGDETSFGGEENEFDERYDEILSYVSAMKEVSASLLQRRFRLGYPRAARLIEIFEEQGVVGPAKGSKPRQVLINEFTD